MAKKNQIHVSVAYCKTAVSPFLTHMRSCSLALTQRYAGRNWLFEYCIIPLHLSGSNECTVVSSPKSESMHHSLSQEWTHTTSQWSLILKLILRDKLDIWIKIQQLSVKNIHSQMASAKWDPFCLDCNMLIPPPALIPYTTRAVTVSRVVLLNGEGCLPSLL